MRGAPTQIHAITLILQLLRQSIQQVPLFLRRTIDPLIRSLEDIVIQEVTLQMDSMRKLIVSEINMFKNVEYDLLNISRQMESLSPGNQI